MSLERSNPVGVHPPGPYTHVVRAGRTLYISGQVAVDPEGRLVGAGDAAQQARQVFANLFACLKAYGAGAEHVAKITMYVVGRENVAAVRAVRSELFPASSLPASTLVIVSGLVDPEWLVEIEAIAHLP